MSSLLVLQDVRFLYLWAPRLLSPGSVPHASHYSVFAEYHSFPNDLFCDPGVIRSLAGIFSWAVGSNRGPARGVRPGDSPKDLPGGIPRGDPRGVPLGGCQGG